MTTPVIEAIGQVEAEAQSRRSRYIDGAIWALVLLGGYLRFDRAQGALGRLLIAIGFLVGFLTVVRMLRQFIRRVAPHMQHGAVPNPIDAWDRERRTSTWRRTKAAGVAQLIRREGLRRARVLTLLGYSVLVLLPGSRTLAVDGSAPLFLRSLVAVAGISLVLALLYSAYRWQRVSRAWARYDATDGPGPA